MSETLISPQARARFVVTLPPEPSSIAKQLESLAASSFSTLTDTKDAFMHLALRARDRLVIMTPFIDSSGATWAADLFESTTASERILILRDVQQLESCGSVGVRLRGTITRIYEYHLAHPQEDGSSVIETFHAKIVLADGVAAYVGSANFLYRSRETNLECGFLLDGDAVTPVAILVDAVVNIFANRNKT